MEAGAVGIRASIPVKTHNIYFVENSKCFLLVALINTSSYITICNLSMRKVTFVCVFYENLFTKKKTNFIE